jgi:hypothetical protein
VASIEMPPYIASKKFALNYAQQLSPSGEVGFIQTMNRSAPFWMAEYTTPPLREDRYRLWSNFFDQLDGSMYTFLAYDPRRPMPYAYSGQLITNDPWTQIGQVAPRITAFDYTNSQITLDRLQNGVTITQGDYISVQIDGVWYLWRSQTQINNVVGNGCVLTVRPRPNIMNFVATNIRYRMACCEMKMLGAAEETDAVDNLPTFTFRGGMFTARAPI